MGALGAPVSSASGTLPPLAVAGPDLVRVAAHRALEALLFVIPWQGAYYLPSGSELSTIVGLGAAGLACAALVTGPRQRLHEAHWLLLAFAGVAVVSLLWTIDGDLTVTRVLTTGQLVGMVLLLWQLGDDAAQRLRFVTAFVAGAVVAATVTLGAYLTAGPDATRERFSTGTAGNANDVGLVLVLAIPLAWYVSLRHPRRWVRVAMRATVPLFLFGMVATASRGAAVTAVLALLIFPVTLRRSAPSQRLLGFVAAPVLLVALALQVPDFAAQRFATIPEQLAEGEVDDRQELWSAALAVFADHPLTGVGAGASRLGIEAVSGRQQGAHNTYLSIGADLGILGLGVFTLALLAVGLAVWRSPAPERSTGLVVLLVLLVGLLPRHWETSKALWAILALLVARLAAPDEPEVDHGAGVAPR